MLGQAFSESPLGDATAYFLSNRLQPSQVLSRLI